MKEDKEITPEKTTGKVELKLSEENAVLDTPKKSTLNTESGADSGTPGGRRLARTKTKPTKRRRRRWPWLVVLVVLVGSGVGVYFWLNGSKTTTGVQGQTTTVNTLSPVGLTVSATGQVQAKADLSLTFASSGTLTELLVKAGDTVTKGQVLAKIDDRDLQTAVKTSKASLDSAKSNLEKTKAGATEQEIKTAEEQVLQAKLKAESTRTGNSYPEDIQSARTQLDAARAKLEQLKQGGTPSEKATAQASVTTAEANLTSAQAKLDALLAGPTAADVSSAQVNVDQAQANLEKTKSNLYTQVVNSQVSRDQALTNLNRAQDKYTAAYNTVYDSNGKTKSGVTDNDIATLTSTKRDLDDAQGNYNKADVSLNDAKVAYDTGIRNAQSTLDNAKIQLEKTKAGATTSDIASAKANVVSAQASLDNAKASVIKLAPTEADLISAQASVDSAVANLAKLTSGGTQTDIQTAESNVRIQEMTLQNLQSGPTTNEIAVQQATVDQAQANYDKAVTQLDNAVLKAPFDGLISSMTVVVGQSVSASTTIVQLIDTSELHVDVSVGESDISKIKLNQAVTLSFDAIANHPFTGKITFISPKSTVTSNVVSYAVTVTLDQGSKNSLQEAFPEQFQKYQQALQPAMPANARATASASSTAAAGTPGSTATTAAVPGGLPAGGLPSGLPAGGQMPTLTQATFCGYSPSRSTSTLTSPKVGMTASITVCLDIRAGTLSVPTRAIKTKVEGGQMVRYVEVLDAAGNKVQKTVTVGLAGDTTTEITGGDLKEGDKVLTNTTGATTTTNNFFPGGPGGPGGDIGGGGLVLR